MCKSHYGKRQIRNFRIAIAIILLFFILVYAYGGGFSLDAFLNAMPCIILFLLFEIGIVPFLKLVTRYTVKSLKKSGKAGYSPKSVMEFYDDSFIEITDENETRQKYTAIERVSIISGKNIYIHINTVMGYILPFDCFENDSQHESFIEFIKTKCSNIDIY